MNMPEITHEGLIGVFTDLRRCCLNHRIAILILKSNYDVALSRNIRNAYSLHQ